MCVRRGQDAVEAMASRSARSGKSSVTDETRRGLLSKNVESGVEEDDAAEEFMLDYSGCCCLLRFTSCLSERLGGT